MDLSVQPPSLVAEYSMLFFSINWGLFVIAFLMQHFPSSKNPWFPPNKATDSFARFALFVHGLFLLVTQAALIYMLYVFFQYYREQTLTTEEAILTAIWLPPIMAFYLAPSLGGIHIWAKVLGQRTHPTEVILTIMTGTNE